MCKIGQNIKKLRKENNLSQFDLCCMVECDKSVISELERGIYNNISIKTLIRFAYVFDVDFMYLCLGDGKMDMDCRLATKENK